MGLLAALDEISVEFYKHLPEERNLYMLRAARSPALGRTVLIAQNIPNEWSIFETVVFNKKGDRKDPYRAISLVQVIKNLCPNSTVRYT